MQPNPQPGFRPNLWVILGCAGVLTLVLIECAFDPLSWMGNVFAVNRLRSQLPLAMELWKSKAVASYDMDVNIFALPACQIKATLHVRENSLTNVDAPANDPWQPTCQSSYKNLTVTEMFRVLGDQLNTLNTSSTALKVGFDPDYGFISQYDSNCGYRIGFLNPNGNNCIVGYQFSNFHPK